MGKDVEEIPMWIGEFRLDRAAQRLWRNGEPVDLVPQVWALLVCLVERAGRIVSKDEILEAAWPGVAVSDMALSQAVRRLRTVFGDDAREPRYIATVNRRGFRLVAPIRAESATALERTEETAVFVGRETERSRLAELLRSAGGGARQVVFIEGDAGIGKTALLSSFLLEHAGGGLRVATAQCVQQQSSAEPYMAVFEALDRLVRSHPDTLDVLRRYAPTWLVQMPWLLGREEARGLESSVTDATRARMLREMGGALEAMSAERSLVLVLEDLHWADPATLDLLGSIARRRDAARLMVVGTYRPIEAIAYDHPIASLARALCANAGCTRLGLESLDRAEIGAYLSQRFSAPRLAASLAERIHARSQGNPLFVVAMVDHLVEGGFIAERSNGWRLTRPVEADDLRDIPRSLREMIELQLAALDAGELELLQAASVAAVEFRSASVAAALEQPGPEGVEAVENACERLIARRHLLSSAGEQTWPDGTRTGSYRFRHELYRQVLYEKIPRSRGRRFHQRIGERLERAFRGDLMRVAAELVSHFDRSGDAERTVTYSLLAAEQARRRYAVPEAAIYLRDALRHLGHLPASPDRDLKELQLRMQLLLARTFTRFADTAEEDRNFSRIEALAALPSAGRDLFHVQQSLVQIYCLRSLPDLAEPIARRLASLASPGLPGERMEASTAMGFVGMMQGRFVQAAEDFARARDLYGEGEPPACAGFAGYETKWREAGALLYTQSGAATFFLGSPDEALLRLQRAMDLCAQRVRPYWAAGALSMVAGILCLRGDFALARQTSDRAAAIAEEHGIEHQVRAAGAQRAWLSIVEGERENALDLIRSGWEDYLSSRRFTPIPIGPLLLLDACRAVGAADEGLRMAEEIWQSTRASGVHWYDAELQRLRGELILLQGKRDARAEAAACFRRALAIAHQQGARFCELRSATSLARLCRGRRNERDVRATLERVYLGFTEGLETPDLRAAEECLRT